MKGLFSKVNLKFKDFGQKTTEKNENSILELF